MWRVSPRTIEVAMSSVGDPEGATSAAGAGREAEAAGAEAEAGPRVGVGVVLLGVVRAPGGGL